MQTDDGTSGFARNDSANVVEGTSTSCGIAKEIPPPPDTGLMRQQRKQSTVVMGVATGVTGFLVGGPLVGVVAGFTGAVITKKKMKKREKKALRNYQTELAELLSPGDQSLF